MPIEIKRLEANDHILRYHFAGNITAADLIALTAHETPLFAGLADDDCFSVIADWSQIETIAASLFSELQHLRLIRDAKKVCGVVVVGANPYLRALAISLGIITQQQRFTFRATLDEALRALDVQ